MTKSINTSWKPGDIIEVPSTGMLSLDLRVLAVTDIYKLLIGGIIPRPIAFISTVNKEGITNLAPFSFFNGAASNPPTLMVSIARKPDGSKKDTLRNIEETGDFVVNGASEHIAAPLSCCAAEYPYGVSEFEKLGLNAVLSEKVQAPRVKEALIQFECELYKTVEIGEGDAGSSTLVLGRILFVHIEKSAYEKGRVKADVLKPIARLGGFNYSTLGEIVSIPIPELVD